MNTSPEYKEIQAMLGTVPVSLQVMEQKGMLAMYFPMLKDMFVDGDDGHIPVLIKKSIAAALSTRCSNTYCFIGHTMYLINNGISREELPMILQQLRIPFRISDHEKWSRVLKWAYMFSDSNAGHKGDVSDADKVIGSDLSEGERRELFTLIMGNTLLNRFSEYYTDEISWQNDVPSGEMGKQMKLLIPDLVSFYHKVSANPREDRPVVNMCMHCKDIKDSAGTWQALETSLASLDKNSLFSHSICPCCYEKHHKETEDKVLAGSTCG